MILPRHAHVRKAESTSPLARADVHPLGCGIQRSLERSMTLPNFLVIGAQRAGTTLLHRILEGHGKVYVPYRRKEIHYFDFYFDRGSNWYSAFFPDELQMSRYEAIGEVTPDYMFDVRVPDRIRTLLPECRFVLSLRNPVDRAFSWYRFCLRSFNEQRGPDQFFSEEEQCLKRGLYSEQLMRYSRTFPKSPFLILIYEELVTNPLPQLQALAAFLGLSCGWQAPLSLVQERINASEIPRFRAAFARAQRLGELLTRHDLDWIVRLARNCQIPQMFGNRQSTLQLSDNMRRRLRDYYAEDVSLLEKMLGRTLNVWSFQDLRGAPRTADEPREFPARDVAPAGRVSQL
jgi:hypothetical protein